MLRPILTPLKAKAMKILTITLLLLAGNSFSQAQILNSSFELSQDTMGSTPIIWKVTNIGSTCTLDHIVSYSGQKSLSMKGISEDAINAPTFKQVVTVDIKTVKSITVAVYMKSEKIKGSAGLFCEFLDHKNKSIGFVNSHQKGIEVTGNKDWIRYNLFVDVKPDVKKIIVGGYLLGVGSVWFDDFSIEGLELPDKLSSSEVVDYKKEVKEKTFDDLIYANSDLYPQLELIEPETLFNAIYGSIGIGGIATYMGYYERILGEKNKNTHLATFLRVGYGGYTQLGVGGPIFLAEAGFITGAQNAHFEGALGINSFISGDLQGITPAGSIGYRWQKTGRNFIFRTGAGYPEALYIGLGLSF